MELFERAAALERIELPVQRLNPRTKLAFSGPV
jgi:hypothetical protein